MKANYPFPVVLIGRDELSLASVRRCLAECNAEILAEHATLREVRGGRDEFPSDPLFICRLGDRNELAEVKRFSAAFAGRPILLLTDDGNNPQTLLAAMRSGASQVVPLPLDEVDFRSALDCIATQFGAEAASSITVAVSGVAGGCGATTLAANLAYEIAEIHQRPTILTELTRQMGMLVTHVDIEPVHTLSDLFNYSRTLDRAVVEAALIPYGEHLRVLAGPARPIAATADLPAKVTSLVACLRQLATTVILDLPCTFDDEYFELLATADHVILVGEQRIPAVRNVQLVLDSLGGRNGRKVDLVLNRYDPTLTKFTSAELATLLNLPRVLTMTNDSARMALALNHGQPLRIAAPNSPVVEDLANLVHAIFSSTLNLSSEPARPSVLRRLRHAFGLI